MAAGLPQRAGLAGVPTLPAFAALEPRAAAGAATATGAPAPAVASSPIATGATFAATGTTPSNAATAASHIAADGLQWLPRRLQCGRHLLQRR